MHIGLVLALASPANATTFEATVRAARSAGPTTQMGEQDLAMARHRKGQTVARLMPQVSVSDTYTARNNNPERYTFSFDSGEDCDPETERFCLPIAFTDGQITLPENTLANNLSLTGVLPITSTTITGVAQQNVAQKLTRIQVKGQDERLVLDLVEQYGELQYVVGALEMYEQSLALAEETREAVRGRYEVGDVTDLDRDKAELDVEEASLAIAQIERVLPTATERLAVLAGRPSDTLQVCPFAEDLDTGVSLDVSGATRLASAEMELKLDRVGRTQAQLAVLPTLNLVAGMSWTGNGETFQDLTDSFLFDNWYVGANLSLTLFDGGGRHHARREAAAAVRKSELDVELERRTLELDDREMATSLTELAENLDLASREVALQTREVEAARSLYFDGGDTTFDRYTQARSVLEQLELQRLNLQRQQLVLTARRWVVAGHVEPLLDTLYDRERAFTDSCRTLTTPAPRRTP